MIENLDDVINYFITITRGKQLKLLPYLEHDFKNFSAVTMTSIEERLKSFNGKKLALTSQQLVTIFKKCGCRVEI